MSTHSSNSTTGLRRRVDNSQRSSRVSKSFSYSGGGRKLVDRYDAYSYSLRAAYLAHLLSPKARRSQQSLAPPRPQPQRTSSSVADLVKDFSFRESKSTRLPKDFSGELDKKITNVLIGKEKSPEYSDPLVKRTFAVFLNELKRADFRKQVDKDRKVEDLLLIFYSNATKELQKGKQPGDESWKLLVDRHVALFVRLISNALKSNDWTRDRPELMTRLATLETKLLRHDDDLTSTSNSNGATAGAAENEPPKSSDVKDMPMVQSVANVFGKSLDSAQNEINEQKDLWTEKAALQDLKLYQTNLSLSNRRTLRSDDFDTEEAYEAWRKAELADLSQMMLTIIRSNLELAKSSSVTIPQFKALNGDLNSSSDRRASDDPSSLVFDQPVDMSGLSLNQSSEPIDDGEPYMFIPSDTRAFYRVVVREALLKDTEDPELQSANANNSVKLLSKRSTELLSELGLRWRIPFISRLMLFMDVVKELYQDQVLGPDTLDAALYYVKEPAMEKKKNADLAELYQREKWPMADYILNQQILNSLHDSILRDLFQKMCLCYTSKMPDIGSLMVILETHIYDDPLFSRTPEDLDRFSASLQQALTEQAAKEYQRIYKKEIESVENIEFFHIIQLGKGVLKLSDRIQKRFRKTPEILLVQPFPILIHTILPELGRSLQKLVESAIAATEGAGEEIAIQDGFDLYKEMVEIRSVHGQALPDVPFPFHIEAVLSRFVWRWVEMTAASVPVWVENAVKQDNFNVGKAVNNGEQPASTSDYHSSSVIDIFRSFNQSIEQIAELKWDDDYQYAKFMTAISKSVEIGLGRFCELLEAMFVKEMDRLTPAQEAQLQETRQEKWMRLAKDAITTKEKVEPFQFLPESFVKLNNIEYAMHHLDGLQSEINVDACAEVINRNEPQTPAAKRKVPKFVFTVKIIEAEDLRACDANGLSDPYVVLGDEKQRRLAKTRIIYANLNPRWDETFDITASGLLNVTATIWDYDTLGDHDCVGRTTIKLDPSHFGDFLPREYWLDLDTQGRLLVRVSMEGEKDDIQFYFGKAFRGLKRTERDMTRKITDKLSAYIHYCLSRRALRALTRQNNLSISSVSSSVSSMLASRNLSSFTNRQPIAPTGASDAEVATALQPLFTYLNENFAIMQQTLTPTCMITVMTRVWKEVLATIESLLVPPLSDKPSAQRQLSEAELDIVFKWLRLLFEFFHAVDEDTQVANGVPVDILRSQKYHDLQSLNYFYYESTETLIRTSERMAVATADRRAAQNKQVPSSSSTHSSSIPHQPSPYTTAPPGSSVHSPAGLLNMPTSSSRTKSIYVSRNLGTMRKAKEAKRREAQAEPSDDMILRILRMRPEAAKYLKDRARQKERLAAAAAAEFIVKQSLAMSGQRRRGV